MFYVYAHFKSDDNTIFYVGVAKLIKRFTSKLGRNRYWHNIVNKHGFYHKIMFETGSWDNCLQKEIEFIKLYGRRDLGLGPLCNLTDGGEGCVNMSIEGRMGISKAHKGKKLTPEQLIKYREAQLGKTRSKETRKKQSEAHKKVDKSYLIGRSIPDEVKEKMRQTHLKIPKKLGIIPSEETREKMRKSHNRVISDHLIREIINLMDSKKFTIKQIASEFEMGCNTLHRHVRKYKATL